jgi:hypothetical protein
VIILPPVIFPATLRFPPIPTPLVTTKAPVVVDIDASTLEVPVNVNLGKSA